MAIKEVDYIPESWAKNKGNYRVRITRDIREALNNRVTMFEFTGDYNYKYLANYARDVANQIFRKDIYLPAAKAIKMQFLTEMGRKGIYLKSDWEYRNLFINISSRKIDDEIHVYAKIDYEFAEKFKEILYKDTLAKYNDWLSDFNRIFNRNGTKHHIHFYRDKDFRYFSLFFG